MGATEDVGPLNGSLTEHEVDKGLVGTRLARLALALEDCVAQLLLQEGARDAVGGVLLFGREHLCLLNWMGRETVANERQKYLFNFI